jgi:hypothetical protein
LTTNLLALLLFDHESSLAAHKHLCALLSTKAVTLNPSRTEHAQILEEKGGEEHLRLKKEEGFKEGRKTGEKKGDKKDSKNWLVTC